MNVSKPMAGTSPNVIPNVKYELWYVNRSSSIVTNVVTGDSYACIRERVWEIFVVVHSTFL
jgi:hypothetical protein